MGAGGLAVEVNRLTEVLWPNWYKLYLIREMHIQLYKEQKAELI